MESNSVSALEKQLQSRVAEQTETAERIISNGYKRLNSKLKKLSAAELNTILSDMESQIEAVRRYMKLGWLRTVGLILAVMIGTGAGSWGYTKFLTHRIQSLQTEYQQTKTVLDRLGRLPVTVVKSQIQFQSKPRLWQAQDGTWVIDLK
jgi:seryl-tRNA(Sec) selenium transferase